MNLSVTPVAHLIYESNKLSEQQHSQAKGEEEFNMGRRAGQERKKKKQKVGDVINQMPSQMSLTKTPHFRCSVGIKEREGNYAQDRQDKRQEKEVGE